MGLEEAGEKVIATPPEEEEGSEQHCGSETVVKTSDAMTPEDFHRAVYRTAVKPLALLGGVLNLKSCLHMFDRRCNEGDGPACHHSSESVTDGWELGSGFRNRGPRVRWERKNVLVENSSVEGQGTKHPDLRSDRFLGSRKALIPYTESMNIQPTSGGLAPVMAHL